MHHCFSFAIIVTSRKLLAYLDMSVLLVVLVVTLILAAVVTSLPCPRSELQGPSVRCLRSVSAPH